MSDDSAFLAEPISQAERLSVARSVRDSLPVFRQVEHGRASGAADIELAVSIELGRVRMHRAEAKQLALGAFVELDKSSDDPVDIVINGQLVARGEIVALDGKFAVRVVHLMPAAAAGGAR